MPNAAAIAAALTTPAAHPYSLIVAGNDVLKQPGAPGASFGVPIESIEITEAGFGSVSSITFSIDDPAKAITINDGDEILMIDNEATVDLDKTIMRARVDRSSERPAFGTGRTIDVSGTGPEAWLDWHPWRSQFNELTFPSSTTTGQTVGSGITAEALVNGWFPPLIVRQQQAGTNGDGFRGIARSIDITTGAWQTSGAAMTNGQTVREILGILVAGATTQAMGAGDGVRVLYTVDMNLLLRAWPDRIAGVLQQPDDYQTMTVADVPSGPAGTVTEDLEVNVEYADVAHVVYVKGGNAAGSGLFFDGTGIRGRAAILNQPSSTTASLAQQYATSFFATQAEATAGRFALTDFVRTVFGGIAIPRACGLVSITDAQTDTSKTFRISEIVKRFNGSGRQSWDVSFGEQPPSAVNVIARSNRYIAGVL